jgi:hypothetical protein
MPIAVSSQIKHLELHFFDNAVKYDSTLGTGDQFGWQSKTGWYSGLPGKTFLTSADNAFAPAAEAFGGARSNDAIAGMRTMGGIRDSSLVNAESSFTVTPNAGAATPVATITTAVNSPFMSPLGTRNVTDDPYIRLDLPASVWPVASTALKVSYSSATGFLTDLAGNRLHGFTNAQCLDRTPPTVTFTLAGNGRNDLYMLFSKNLDLSSGLSFQNGITLTLNGTTILHPTAITPLSGNRALLFTLPSTLTAEQIVDSASTISMNSSGTAPDPDTGINESVSYFRDTVGNYVPLTETHRVTDIALNVVDILYGSDGINAPGLLGTSEGALRTFDGTGRLLDRDITIATHLETDSSLVASKPLTLFFDVNPPASVMPNLFNLATGLSNKLWLPSVIPSFNSSGNAAARVLSPETILDTNRLFRNFLIPEADPEVVPGSNVQMLFMYGDLYCARLTNPADITSLAPWSFNISETKKQRGGVTILNNVIDSNKREKTILEVEVPKAGNIVIQVFTMDGNVVKVLDRGRKGGGTYTYYWDGTNGAGNPVASGMYFIRVDGPNMDEIRKVMVVKE